MTPTIGACQRWIWRVAFPDFNEFTAADLTSATTFLLASTGTATVSSYPQGAVGHSDLQP
jgi:hypothetical protein